MPGLLSLTRAFSQAPPHTELPVCATLGLGNDDATGAGFLAPHGSLPRYQRTPKEMSAMPTRAPMMPPAMSPVLLDVDAAGEGAGERAVAGPTALGGAGIVTSARELEKAAVPPADEIALWMEGRREVTKEPTVVTRAAADEAVPPDAELTAFASTLNVRDATFVFV